MDKIFQNYIFDLDGTLINSCEEVLECFKKAYKQSGYPIDETRLSDNLIGPPLKEIILNISPELKDEITLSKIISNFRNIYDNNNDDKSELYSDVLGKLNELKKEGKRLFLATLKPSKPTERIIRDFKLNFFEDVYTIDKFQKLMTKREMITDIIEKNKLKKEDTVMIGDAPSDVISAKEAGITGVGALWGYGTDKTNLIKNSDFSLKSIGDLKV